METYTATITLVFPNSAKAEPAAAVTLPVWKTGQQEQAGCYSFGIRFAISDFIGFTDSDTREMNRNVSQTRMTIQSEPGDFYSDFNLVDHNTIKKHALLCSNASTQRGLFTRRSHRESMQMRADVRRTYKDHGTHPPFFHLHECPQRLLLKVQN